MDASCWESDTRCISSGSAPSDVVGKPSSTAGRPKRKRERVDPVVKKARQAEKNRETARRFRDKMDNLRKYLDEQVVGLTWAYRTLFLFTLKFGKAPKRKEPLIEGGLTHRARTCHL